jgi:hypothetical protein
MADIDMDYEKIDVCKKNCMSIWMEHKDDIECMHDGRSRYVKVVNEDGVYYLKSGDPTTSLHAYHTKAKTVVPI